MWGCCRLLLGPIALIKRGEGVTWFIGIFPSERFRPILSGQIRSHAPATWHLMFLSIILGQRYIIFPIYFPSLLSPTTASQTEKRKRKPSRIVVLVLVTSADRYLVDNSESSTFALLPPTIPDAILIKMSDSQRGNPAHSSDVPLESCADWTSPCRCRRFEFVKRSSPDGLWSKMSHGIILRHSWKGSRWLETGSG